MVGFLTAIWDEPIFVEQTRKTGKVTIHNPYFTLLGCCTPKWVSEKLKSDVITDGFSRRVIWQLEKDRACLNPRPQTSPEKIQALLLLHQEAQRIFQLQGQFELSNEACVKFDRLYYQTAKIASQYSEKIQSYFTSKHDLLYKVAMCISAGLNNSRLITSQVLDTANAFLLQSERCLETVFAGIGRNELKSQADRALEKVRQAGTAGMTKAQFAKANYENLNKAELDEVWDMLALTGETNFVNPGSAQDAPRMRAVVLDPLPPAINLLELVSQLKWTPEEKQEGSQAFDIASRLAPATRQLLDSLAERKRLSERGILLKGTSVQVSVAEGSS